MHACLHVHVYICMFILKNTYIQIHIYKYAHIYIYIHMYMYIYVCIYVCRTPTHTRVLTCISIVDCRETAQVTMPTQSLGSRSLTRGSSSDSVNQLRWRSKDQFPAIAFGEPIAPYLGALGVGPWGLGPGASRARIHQLLVLTEDRQKALKWNTKQAVMMTV